jgi:hypothetical protein
MQPISSTHCTFHTAAYCTSHCTHLSRSISQDFALASALTKSGLYLLQSAWFQVCPAAAHGFRQVQQNPCLHLPHVMCMQPWFFSMRVEQLGHFLVLAMIQVAFMDSVEHFSFQSLTWSQLQGSCESRPHLKQKEWEQLQVTDFTPRPAITPVQPGAGHHRSAPHVSMKFLV